MTNPVEMLAARRGDRTLKAFAAEVNCSEAYLCMVLNKKREPGPRVLKFLGLARVKSVTYLPKPRRK